MNPARTNRLEIMTPEGVRFSLIMAGPLTRFIAWLIDVCTFMAVINLISIPLSMMSYISLDIYRALNLVAYFVLSMGYWIVMEWALRGQTVGKRLMRLRVMDRFGMRLKPSQIILRNIMRVVDSAPAFYFVGGMVMMINPHYRRLGDIAAGTVVVRMPVVSEPDLDTVLGEKYNSFTEYPHLAARLRQRVSPALATVALQALMRREELDAQQRVEVFREMADGFRTLVSFPREAVQGLSDERYVGNAVDVVYRDTRARKKVSAATARGAADMGFEE